MQIEKAIYNMHIFIERDFLQSIKFIYRYFQSFRYAKGIRFE